jgi:hypothetical protein
MDHFPSERRKSAAALDISFPGASSEVVLLSVALDSNHQVGISKIHPRNEVTAMVEDLILAFGRHKEMNVQELQKPSLKRAARNGELKFALLQDLRYLRRSRPALCPQPGECLADWAFGHKAAPPGFIDHMIKSLAIQVASHIDDGARRIRDSHSVEPAKVARFELRDPSDANRVVG